MIGKVMIEHVQVLPTDREDYIIAVAEEMADRILHESKAIALGLDLGKYVLDQFE